MGTAEILIVFSALMALIALVTIGIDWIGKPLKHRRFIPRLYRFEDEKLPIDAYGNTQLPASGAATASSNSGLTHAPYPAPVAPPVVQPPPVVVAQVPPSNATVRVPVAQPAEAPPEPVAARASSSAFSDILSPDGAEHSMIAGASKVGEEAAPALAAWSVGLPLDKSVEGRKPSLAVKAERFWITTADLLADSHFDDENIDRMAAGKAPRRPNPRTGRMEAMLLTGLRQASTHAQVRMRWPDDAADPWAGA